MHGLACDTYFASRQVTATARATSSASPMICFAKASVPHARGGRREHALTNWQILYDFEARLYHSFTFPFRILRSGLQLLFIQRRSAFVATKRNPPLQLQGISPMRGVDLVPMSQTVCGLSTWYGPYPWSGSTGRIPAA